MAGKSKASRQAFDSGQTVGAKNGKGFAAGSKSSPRQSFSDGAPVGHVKQNKGAHKAPFSGGGKMAGKTGMKKGKAC